MQIGSIKVMKSVSSSTKLQIQCAGNIKFNLVLSYISAGQISAEEDWFGQYKYSTNSYLFLPGAYVTRSATSSNSLLASTSFKLH